MKQHTYPVVSEHTFTTAWRKTFSEGTCMQLDCSIWQEQIAAALAAPSSTPITPSLPLLTALLNPWSADEAEGYAQEAQALADQVPTGELCLTHLH